LKNKLTVIAALLVGILLLACPVRKGMAAAFDVRAFGAKGDGKTLDTPAFNKAIAAAAKAGGGTVTIPAGTYLCTSIHLQSNITLYVDQGATVLAADATQGTYDPAEPYTGGPYQDYGHVHWHNSLIWGENLHDVSILGPGLLYGKGLNRGQRSDLAPTPGGNKTISLKNCHNVTLRDFSILQGGWFGILATGVDNLTIDNLKIDTNRDGMDLDCCRNVRVLNCSVNSPWDDGICPKSSYALGYARATENVTITGCYVTGAYQLGTMLDGTWKRFDASQRAPHTGRIKCGTESNGGFKNITITNCVFDGCQGLALETVDGALLEDITISNITMRDITSAPIFLRLGARLRGPAGTVVGHLRRVNISNIEVSNSGSNLCCILSGIPGHPLEDIHLSNIHIQTAGGGTAAQAALVPAEDEDKYPEPSMFGTMPAYGFFLRHIQGLTMHDVDVTPATPDARPAFSVTDVTAAMFRDVKDAPANLP
jgi:polygalacturonase